MGIVDELKKAYSRGSSRASSQVEALRDKYSARKQQRETEKVARMKDERKQLNADMRSLRKEKKFLEKKQEVRELKRQVRAQKLEPLTSTLSKLRNMTSNARERRAARGLSSRVASEPKYNEGLGKAPDVYGFQPNKSPFTQGNKGVSNKFQVGTSRAKEPTARKKGPFKSVYD